MALHFFGFAAIFLLGVHLHDDVNHRQHGGIAAPEGCEPEAHTERQRFLFGLEGARLENRDLDAVLIEDVKEKVARCQRIKG